MGPLILVSRARDEHKFAAIKILQSHLWPIYSANNNKYFENVARYPAENFIVALHQGQVVGASVYSSLRENSAVQQELAKILHWAENEEARKEAAVSRASRKNGSAVAISYVNDTQVFQPTHNDYVDEGVAVLPSYRVQGVCSMMYDFLFNELKNESHCKIYTGIANPHIEPQWLRSGWQPLLRLGPVLEDGGAILYCCKRLNQT